MKKRIIVLSLIGVVVVAAAVAAFLFLRRGPEKTSQPVPPPQQATPQTATAAPGKEEQSPKPAEQKTSDQHGPSSGMTSPSFYKYTAADKRDPFIPLIAKTETEKRKGGPPLESHEVSELRLIGVAWSKTGFFAQVLLPDGKSYTLREGMKLGPYHGVVQKITKDSVTIRESIRDYKGVLKPRDTVLKLRLEEQG